MWLNFWTTGGSKTVYSLCDRRSKTYRRWVVRVSADVEPLQPKLSGLAGDAVQLCGVRQTDTDGVDVNTGRSALFCLRDGAAGVDVGDAVCDDDGHVGYVWTVSAGCREHLFSHRLQGVCRVGAAMLVWNVLDG